MARVITESAEKGDSGEFEIIRILKQLGVKQIRRPDIVFLNPVNHRWYQIEVKNKEPFSPPPDWLQGFPQSQFLKDMHIDTAGLLTLYVVRGRYCEWLCQYVKLLNPIMEKPHTRDSATNVYFSLTQFIPIERFFKERLRLQGGC